MAGSSGDSVTRRSVASQFFTQEEGLGIDGMTTSERVSMERRAWCGGVTAPVGVTHPRVAEPREAKGAGLARPAAPPASLSVQVVDLLNQAALITNDSKITVLKQVRGWGAVGKQDTGGRVGICEKEDSGHDTGVHLEHLGDAGHGACPHLTFTTAL